MAKGYRKVTINNNGKEEIWEWMYGKSTISIRSPENKGYHIDIQNNFSRSITPKHIVNYICSKILHIKPPVTKETTIVQNKENNTVFPRKKVFIVYRNSKFDFSYNTSIFKIFHDPADAKKCQKEMNEQAKNELKVILSNKYGRDIDDDEIHGFGSLSYTSDIHEVY